jgi:hypothetical protein
MGRTRSGSSAAGAASVALALLAAAALCVAAAAAAAVARAAAAAAAAACGVRLTGGVGGVCVTSFRRQLIDRVRMAAAPSLAVGGDSPATSTSGCVAHESTLPQ